MPLKCIEGLDTRPTTDRIKETLFNMLQPEIPGCRFLDLFGGSGAIGIEALSRGADFAAFAENNRKAYDCIGDNLVFTKLNDRARVFFMDALGALRVLEGEEPFDILEASLNEETDWVEDLGYRIRKVKKYKTNKHLFIEMDEDDE